MIRTRADLQTLPRYILNQDGMAQGRVRGQLRSCPYKPTGATAPPDSPTLPAHANTLSQSIMLLDCRATPVTVQICRPDTCLGLLLPVFWTAIEQLTWLCPHSLEVMNADEWRMQ